MIKPDLVLRVGVAGNREMSVEQIEGLQSRLRTVFQALDERLKQLAPGLQKFMSEPELALTKFYSNEKPTLRLVSGLADGADQEASEICLGIASEHVRHEVAAVLPFDRDTYRDCSPVNAKDRFNNLIGKCRYVYEVDGRYEANPNPADDDHYDNDFAKDCRGRAYQAQSEVLLRQCDLLIAICDPEKKGRTGGTRQAMDLAMELGLPVLFVPLGSECISLVWTARDLKQAITIGSAKWKSELENCVTDLVANPLSARPGHHTAAGSSGKSSPLELSPQEEDLLNEFFSDREPRKSVRQWVWEKFESFFKTKTDAHRDVAIHPFASVRSRATTLNYNYSGLYRGTFLLNYVLAVVAVALAVVSLVLLMLPTDPHGNSALELCLLGLALAKLCAVIVILRTTHSANHERWNDKAVDFRYLAERLRTMYYLPPRRLLPSAPAEFLSLCIAYSPTECGRLAVPGDSSANGSIGMSARFGRHGSGRVSSTRHRRGCQSHQQKLDGNSGRLSQFEFREDGPNV